MLVFGDHGPGNEHDVFLPVGVRLGMRRQAGGVAMGTGIGAGHHHGLIHALRLRTRPGPMAFGCAPFAAAARTGTLALGRWIFRAVRVGFELEAQRLHRF